MKKEKIVVCMLLTALFQAVSIVMLILGKFTFFQFIVSITLLDILHVLESRELKEIEKESEGK